MQVQFFLRKIIIIYVINEGRYQSFDSLYFVSFFYFIFFVSFFIYFFYFIFKSSNLYKFYDVWDIDNNICGYLFYTDSITFPIRFKEYCIALTVWNVQVPDNKKKLQYCCNESSKCAPNVLVQIPIMRPCWQFHMSYCLNFKNVLPKTRCMRPGIIVHAVKIITNYCNVKYDGRFQYLVGISSSRQSVIPNDMQDLTSTCADLSP